MPDPDQERLARCFERLFPKLSRGAICTADQESVDTWDSIAQVTLVSLIGEEFGLEIDFADFEDATSFPAMLDVVRRLRNSS